MDMEFLERLGQSSVINDVKVKLIITIDASSLLINDFWLRKPRETMRDLLADDSKELAPRAMAQWQDKLWVRKFLARF